MNYNMVIMHRKTREVMVILDTNNTYDPPMIILQNYARWGGFELKDLLYAVVDVVNYNKIVCDLKDQE